MSSFRKAYTKPTRTKSSFGELVNINTVVRKMRATGTIPVRDGQPYYGDFTGANDLQDTLNRVRDMERIFQALPSAVRRRCKNDPVQFVRFVENPENRREGVELGLFEPTDEERAEMRKEEIQKARQRLEELEPTPQVSPRPPDTPAPDA